MSIFNRSVAMVGLLLGIISCWGSAVFAADWPHRTVRLIVPLPAGAAPDFSARLFADRLSQRWGQAVIVENRPGADGVIGVSAFLGTNDDHTLLYAISAVFTVHPITNTKLPYDPARELVPIAPTSDVVLAIAAPAKSSIRSLGGLVQTALAQPGKLNWASSPGLPPRCRRVLEKFEAGSRFGFLSGHCSRSPRSGRRPHRYLRWLAGCNYAAGAIRPGATPCNRERRSRAACS